jgi:hypothetical protein
MAELRIQGVAQRIAKEISVSPLRAYPSKDVTTDNSAMLSAYGDGVSPVLLVVKVSVSWRGIPAEHADTMLLLAQNGALFAGLYV